LPAKQQIDTFNWKQILQSVWRGFLLYQLAHTSIIGVDPKREQSGKMKSQISHVLFWKQTVRTPQS